MWKFFLLIAIAWLRRIPGTGGLIIMVMYFLFLSYSMRYRGHHGRLSTTEKSSLRLESDVEKHGMRAQWDVIPWPGTAKHVIRKWTWDRIALDTTLQQAIAESTDALSNAYTKLCAFAENKPGGSKSNPYSGTLAVFEESGHTSHTPLTALKLLGKASKNNAEWNNQAICMLGGTFVICAESFKGEVKSLFKDKKQPRMASGTVADTSRITWKAGQLFLNPGTASIGNFVTAIFSRINPWDKHAVVEYRGDTYYAPTTMFGASATMMKVMNLCEVLELNREEMMIVGYSVALHWIDKYLNDDSWILGGKFTPDRHSLIEALQGMYAHIDNDPDAAAAALVEMYEKADEARKGKLD